MNQLCTAYTIDMIIYYNPNPRGKIVGDCVVRAITAVTGFSWDRVYSDLCDIGYEMADMPSSNAVWSVCLRRYGFARKVLPNKCPDCYTIAEFARTHPRGAYVVATGTHAVAVIDGTIYDSWDSSQEIPIYYFEKVKR